MQCTPYTYLIGWSAHNKYYYGSQYHKKANPKDLWTKYFTSSKFVKQFRKHHGEPDIIQVRQCFTDPKNALMFEDTVLRRLNVSQQDKWLNRCVGGNLKSRLGVKFTEEHKQKLREKSLGRLHTEETKQKLREKALLRPPASEETRKRMSESTKNRVRSPLTDRQKKNISEGKKGKPYTITDKVRRGWENRPSQTDNQKQKAREANLGHYRITYLDGTVQYIVGIKDWVAANIGIPYVTFKWQWHNKKLNKYNMERVERILV